MKQSTQRFLARLLVLLLVLGLLPAMPAGSGLISEAAAAEVNGTYLWAADTVTGAGGYRPSLNSGRVDLYYNGVTGYSSRTLTITGTITNPVWKLGGVTVERGGSYSNSYVRLTVASDGRSATITALNSIYSYNSTVSVSGTSGVQSWSTSCTVRTNPTTTNTGSSLSVSVYGNAYYLGETDSTGGTSMVTQLVNKYSSLYSNVNGVVSYGFVSLEFTNVSHTYGRIQANTYTSYTETQLRNIWYVPSSNTYSASFPVIVTYWADAAHTTMAQVNDTLYFYNRNTTITTAAGGEINYSGAAGENVYFNAEDFRNFYYSATNGGTLYYVNFSTPSSSNGRLYANTGTSLSSGTNCYYTPTSSQTALDSVYFTPSNTVSTTVRISFTAYGNRNYYTGSIYDSNYGYNYGAISGTVVISYTNGVARDITYVPAAGSVKLNSTDFTNVYREVVGSSAPSNLAIQFQSVPAHGTLTYNSVTLTSSNIRSYRFTASQLNQITYTSSNTTYNDTISYIAYAGSTSRYTGTVIFNPNSLASNIAVNFSSTGSGVYFNQTSFNQANANVMANTYTVRFTIPGNGTLSYNGTPVTINGVDVPVSALSSVYYRPNTNFNSTDRVAFYCYNASGTQIGSGQVYIQVTGNTVVGATTISQFYDVPSNAWYRTELADLVSKGIMQGTGNGRFEPAKQVTYGEALKMVLKAAGYTCEEVPGNEWAINYKNLAVSRGWISSDIVLTAGISRNAVAELTCRVLGIPASNNASPFSDAANKYAIALYYTTPQIIMGERDTKTGNTYFRNNRTLARQEICAIIYRVNSYVNNQYSTTRPDGV